jgi:tetratricopeptide (TPR) repeat protein
MRSENVAAAADFALGHLSDARVGFARALSLADMLGDDLMIARCANNLGNIDYYLAEYSRALSSYGLARASFEKVGWQKGLAEVALNRCIVFRERGELHASIVDGDRAIDYAEAADDRRLVGQGIAARAETRAHLDDFETATAEADRAYRIAVAEVNPLDEADALRVRSVIERLRRNPTEAVQFGTRALEIVRPMGHAWTTAEAERDLAEAYLTRGMMPDAIACLESAGQALRQMGAVVRVEAVEKKLEDLRGSA